VPKATSRTYQIKTKDRLATLSRDYACVCPVRREDQRECLALVEVAAIGAARPIRSCGDGCDELPSQVAYTVSSWSFMPTGLAALKNKARQSVGWRISPKS
jgi:hypothetical protein